MKLGTKSRSKKPNCRHFGADGTLEDKYVVVYVEQHPFGYRTHLHCSECNVTAQNALPKKTAEKFDGFGVRPDGANACVSCGEWFNPNYTENPAWCDACDTGKWICDNCGKPTEWISEHDDYCKECTTSQNVPLDVEKFEDYRDPPKRPKTCTACGKDLNPKNHTLCDIGLCDQCHSLYWICDNCGTYTEWISEYDNLCHKCTNEI